MAAVNLKVNLPKQQGLITVLMDLGLSLGDVKLKLGEAIAKRGLPLLSIDNYNLRITSSQQVLSSETIRLSEIVKFTTLVAGTLEMDLCDLDPLTSVWKERTVAKSPDHKGPVSVRVNLPGGSQTMALSGDETLREVKARLQEKLTKQGSKQSNVISCVLQVTDSGLLLANDDISVLDVFNLERLALSHTLVLTLKLDDVKQAMANSATLSANYRTGMLNFQRDAKPNTKTKKMRYFVLDEFTLRQFDIPDDQLPKRTLIVHADSEISIDEQNSTPKMFYLLLHVNGLDAFRVGCSSNEERRLWLGCLNTARLCHFRFVLQQCVSHLNEQALQVPGLFRVSARDSDVMALKKQFDEGRTDIELSKVDAHVVATALKRYLRGLPEPLLTHDLYSRFLATQSIGDEDERAHAMSVVLSLLPPINRLLLQYLIAFLARVCGYSQVNDMTPSNLATVFAPSLLAKRGETPEDAIADTSARLHLIRLLISEYDFFFAENDSGDDTDRDLDDLGSEDMDLNLNNSDQGVTVPLQSRPSISQTNNSLDAQLAPPDLLQRPLLVAPQSAEPAPSATATDGDGGPLPNPNNYPLARATFDFEAKDPQHQLTLKKGEWVLIAKKNPTGWWLGECAGGRKGLFPYNYVRLEESKKDGTSTAERVLSSAPVYMGARRTGQNTPDMGTTGAGGGGVGDGDVVRQRFEDEAHARRQAEEARRALAALLEETKRGNMAEQRTREEMSQRISAMLIHTQELTSRATILEREKEQAVVAQVGLQKKIVQLQADAASATSMRDSLLGERGKLDSAIKLAVQSASGAEKDRVAVILQHAMTATVPESSTPVAEQLAIENGRRAELEHQCVGLSVTASQMLPLCGAHLVVKGRASLADELLVRHNARLARQLDIARTLTAQLAQLQIILQEEVNDIVSGFAS